MYLTFRVLTSLRKVREVGTECARCDKSCTPSTGIVTSASGCYIHQTGANE